MNGEQISPLMLSGAVLSGGFSSRFGQDKGRVKLGPHPMVVHAVRALAEVVDEVVVAVASGKKSDYMRLVGEDVRVVEDRRPGRGPLQGLVTALEASKGDYVQVCPCDTPFIRPAVCKMMIERARGKDGAVPVIRGYLEPLHAAYRRTSCVEAFSRTLDSGSRKVKDSYQSLDLVPVDEHLIRGVDRDLISFVNINSDEELRRAETFLR